MTSLTCQSGPGTHGGREGVEREAGQASQEGETPAPELEAASRPQMPPRLAWGQPRSLSGQVALPTLGSPCRTQQAALRFHVQLHLMPLVVQEILQLQEFEGTQAPLVPPEHSQLQFPCLREEEGCHLRCLWPQAPPPPSPLTRPPNSPSPVPGSSSGPRRWGHMASRMSVPPLCYPA